MKTINATIMKRWMQKISAGIKARCNKQAFLKADNISTSFEPAPSFWALIPVKVEMKKDIPQKND